VCHGRVAQLASGRAARLAEMLSASARAKNHLNSHPSFILTFLSLFGHVGAPKTAEELFSVGCILELVFELVLACVSSMEINYNRTLAL